MIYLKWPHCWPSVWIKHPSATYFWIPLAMVVSSRYKNKILQIVESYHDTNARTMEDIQWPIKSQLYNPWGLSTFLCE